MPDLFKDVVAVVLKKVKERREKNLINAKISVHHRRIDCRAKSRNLIISNFKFDSPVKAG